MCICVLYNSQCNNVLSTIDTIGIYTGLGHMTWQPLNNQSEGCIVFSPGLMLWLYDLSNI